MDDSIDLFCGRSTLYLEDAVSGSGGDSFANETAEKSKVQKEFDGKVKQEQAQRALPANYARQLVEQSEVLVKKNLEEQVKKFQTMAETMRRRKEDMLTKVEKENCHGEHLLMRMIHRKRGLFLEQEIRQIMLLSKNFMLYYVTMRLKFNKVIWL